MNTDLPQSHDAGEDAIPHVAIHARVVPHGSYERSRNGVS